MADGAPMGREAEHSARTRGRVRHGLIDCVFVWHLLGGDHA